MTSTSEIQIDISNLSQGVYLLKITARNNQFIKRLVKL
ncbi:T9SS type A sorting domain-containing protein [Seonamhaeicola sp.]